MPPPSPGRRVITAILSAGSVAGVLDGLAASIQAWLRGINPTRVFQYISSALLGPSSYERGPATIALGIFLHFFIAFCAATVFVLASLRLPILIRRAVFFGVIYGVVVYFFMSRVVVPLSAARTPPFSFRQLIIGILIHIFCIGLPIALLTRRAVRNDS